MRMESQLKLSVVLPLKQMALRRVVFQLVCEKDIFPLIFDIFLSGHEMTRDNERKWQDIEKKMKTKMLELELIESLKEEVIGLVRPAGWQIRRFASVSKLDSSNSSDSLFLNSSKLSFTTDGKINFREMAEQFVCCDALSAGQRYRLAAVYCLEDYIHLVDELDEQNSKAIFRLIYPDKLNLELFWAFTYCGKLSVLDQWLERTDSNMTSLNQWAFEYSAWRGNKVAVEYFFLKLTEKERDESLMRTVEFLLNYGFITSFWQEGISEVCCNLISLLSPTRQIELVQKQPVEILFCLLDLPWHDLFMENVELIWTLITLDDFSKVLSMLARRYLREDLRFSRKFQALFVHSPLNFKSFFLDPESGADNASNLLDRFVRGKDVESVKVLFNIVDAPNRYKVFQEAVLLRFYHDFLKGRCHMLEVCLREAMLSKEDMKRLKENSMKIFFKNGRSQENKSCKKKRKNVKNFFGFLDRTNKDINGLKRKQENDGAGSSKYLCK